MPYKQDYEMWLTRHNRIRQSNPMSEEVWFHQTKRYIEPFRIYGNFYYVGDSWVCAHLVDTGDGLLLFDAGNCGGDGKAILLYSIWKMGFDPADIRWCILSHAHVDHIGLANFLRDMFGTKIYLSDIDARMMEEQPELVLLQESTDIADYMPLPDYCIHDGETLCFGGIRVYFVTVPGHTLGTLACFFNVDGPQGTKRVGYFGGYGFNTMTKAHLLETGDPAFEIRQAFLHSIDKVIDEPVDIFMANHTDNGNYLQKIEKVRQGVAVSPFIDPDIWRNYLSEKKQAMEAFMQDPRNN